jgi:hypothetical protein
VSPAALARVAYAVSRAYGLDPRAFWRSTIRTPRFLRQLWQFQQATENGQPSVTRLYPILAESDMEAAALRNDYFQQDLFVARRIFEAQPTGHIDVGSRIDGFVAHLLSFALPVRVVDIRPMTSVVRGLEFIQSDATRMSGFADQSISSLSSLHTVEHFGLGRYGDPIDPNACFAAMQSLARVLAPHGRLYFSVPIGRERVEFNAHRVLSPTRVATSFPGLDLVRFDVVVQGGQLIEQAEPAEYEKVEYACGIYELTRSVG